MKTIHINALEGPNLWSKRRVLEVEFESVAAATESMESAWRQVIAWWRLADAALRPSDIAGQPWPESPGNDSEALLALTVNFQRRMDLSVSEGFVLRNAVVDHSSRIVVEFVEESVGRKAWDLACDTWSAARCGREFDLALRLKELSEFAFQVCLGTTTGSIVNVARARGIPVIRLDDVSLVQLGHGVRQRRIQTAITDRSGHIAETVSRDKVLTKSLLKRLGVPVPDGRPVRDADDAWIAACEVGLPVVVKPCDADYGNGVSLKLTTRTEVASAYDAARAYSPHVLVERFLAGVHHRVTVVGGRVVAAVRREPVVVVGDGLRTVRALIDEMNLDPRRGAEDDLSRPWMWIEVDDELRRVLASQESGLDAVPAINETVVLRFDPHVCWGGGVIDVTDEIHPDVAAMIVDAVAMVGLDVAGVDLIATDISKPLTQQHGGVLEVNAGPAIFLHLSPICHPPRPVPETIVSLMFPDPRQARIPVLAVCGDDQNQSLARRLVQLVRPRYATIGQATSAGVFVDRRCLCSEPGNTLVGAQILLAHPRVDAAVCEVSLVRLREEGLAFDQCLVAIALGSQVTDGDLSNDEVRAGLRVMLDAALPHGTAILNVDDPLLAEIALQLGSSVVAVSTSTNSSVVAMVRERGGRAVFLSADGVTLAHGSQEFPLLPLPSRGGRPEYDRTSALTLLATLAAGWELGIAPELLRYELNCAA
jgi:cyanophycin synthetase